MNLSPGTSLGRYRIEAVLGQGQAGIVYRGFDPVIERPVAIKCLRPSAGTNDPAYGATGMQALVDEAKVIGQLNHPHIAGVYDLGSFEAGTYIVMEFVQGETLKAKLARTAPATRSAHEALSFLVMVARALHYVHQRGILHGDIKPANLMVTAQGTPKIMDFGIARRSLAGPQATWSLLGEDQVWGTPGYVAPEQLTANQIDARADVFSLGVVAYEWLAGRKPFSGANVDQTLKAVLEQDPTPLHETGAAALDISLAIGRALLRDPNQRFPSADAFADALEVCDELWSKRSPLPQAGAPGAPMLQRSNLLFADFSEEELAAVVAMAHSCNYASGDTIVREGEGGSTMYLVVHGRVSVRKQSAAQVFEIKQISAGECFGEMAVISQMPRSATIVALEETEVLAISGAVLRSQSPRLSMKLYRNIAALLSDRLRDVDAQVVSLLQTNAPSNAGRHDRK